MKQGISIKTLFCLTFFFFTSTYGEAVSAFSRDAGYKKKNFYKKDVVVKSPNSIGSFLGGYIFSKPSTSTKTILLREKSCHPKNCLTHKEHEGRDHKFIQQQKDARFLRRALYQRQLQRGSRSSHKDSSSKYYYTIVYVCVSVLIFMIMVCVGLRYYIGIPQDHSPELTERKKVMKDMTEGEKRSVLEYIFSKQQQQKEVDNEDKVAVLETDSNNSSATDILDETETTNQSRKKQREVSEDDVGESGILGSIKKEGNSEVSVDTKSTRSLNVADSQEEDVVCSICLDSFDGQVAENSDGVLSAPHCSRRFHKECIMDWFLSQSSNMTCPDCRSQMFTVDELRAAAEALDGMIKTDEEDVA